MAARTDRRSVGFIIPAMAMSSLTACMPAGAVGLLDAAELPSVGATAFTDRAASAGACRLCTTHLPEAMQPPRIARKAAQPARGCCCLHTRVRMRPCKWRCRKEAPTSSPFYLLLTLPCVRMASQARRTTAGCDDDADAPAAGGAASAPAPSGAAASAPAPDGAAASAPASGGAAASAAAVGGAAASAAEAVEAARPGLSGDEAEHAQHGTLAPDDNSGAAGRGCSHAVDGGAGAASCQAAAAVAGAAAAAGYGAGLTAAGPAGAANHGAAGATGARAPAGASRPGRSIAQEERLPAASGVCRVHVGEGLSDPKGQPARSSPASTANGTAPSTHAVPAGGTCGGATEDPLPGMPASFMDHQFSTQPFTQLG
eukprot:365840-Chlamydomonas_euryale.AAC.3